jgi:hypothetical protein
VVMYAVSCSPMPLVKEILAAAKRGKRRRRSPTRSTCDACSRCYVPVRSRSEIESFRRGFTAKKEWVRRVFCAVTHPIAWGLVIACPQTYFWLRLIPRFQAPRTQGSDHFFSPGPATVQCRAIMDTTRQPLTLDQSWPQSENRLEGP